MDKKIIARNFSKCASVYDRYADMQKKAALVILGGIRDDNFSNVLEIGCGTGNYTLLLRKKFSRARITALDISGKMVAVAQGKLRNKGVDFIVGDGESVNFPEGAFDLITSNACFQWFEVLENTLERYRAMLKSSGLLAFSIFGPMTFWELSASLESLMRNTDIAARKFIDKDRMKNILDGNFNNVSVKEAVYKESFACLSALLNKIKHTGARGNGSTGKLFFSRQKLNELEGVYLNKFRRIKASYQVFFCRGRA